MRSRPSMLACASLATAIALSGAPAAHAYAPEATPDRRLEGAVIDAARHPAARGATPAAIIVRGRTVVARRNPNRTLIPASLMKLATTSAAVLRFGPDHRFVTRVRAAGGSASVPQTLYLVGGGDPTLSTNAYRRKRFLPDKPGDGRPAFASGSPTIEQLAGRVDAAGVRRIAGDLVVDESWFDDDRVPDGWPSRYFGYDPESGYASALTINENRTNLRRTAIDPQPAIQAGREFRTALARRGIRVAGSIRAGRAPSSSRGVANVASPPLSEIVDFINRYSANFQAEILFKALGAGFGRIGSYAEGQRIVREALVELDVPVAGFRASGGSGLSRDDRVTVRTIAMLLSSILTEPSLDAVRRSIPVAGGLGTLRTRLNRWPTAGNLRGKTGLLRGVRGLAGWVRGIDGTPVVYVGLYNGARSALALTSPLDLLALATAFHPSV